jgi:hypothetical protein
MTATTTITTDIIYDYPLANPATHKLTCYTEVIVYRTYGRYEDPAQPIHTRVWRMLLPFKITNQSRAEAIGRRRPNFCRVIHL